MTRGVGRTIAAGVLGATVATAWLALFYAIRPTLRIDFAADAPQLVSGAYPAERDEASGLTFAWTGEEFALRLPGIDRRVDWILDVRVRGARPDPSENPDLIFLADGVPLLARHAETDFDNVRVTIPANAARRRGALIAIRSSRTVVPGSGDTRALGVMLDWVTLRPAGIVLAPWTAFAGAAIGGAALGAAVAALGVTAGSAVGAAVLLGAGEASILARGSAPYTAFMGTSSTRTARNSHGSAPKPRPLRPTPTDAASSAVSYRCRATSAGTSGGGCSCWRRGAAGACGTWPWRTASPSPWLHGAAHVSHSSPWAS